MTSSPVPEGPPDTGTLGSGSLVAFSLASFFPAVGIALVPLLVFSTAGETAWLSSLLATVAVICIGRAVITFARRFVSTGSIYSYVAEVFGPWARYLAAASLLAGYVVAIGALAAVVGLFTGSFLLGQGMADALTFGPQSLIMLAAVGIAALVAFRGIDTSIWVAVGLSVVSIPLVLVITVASAAHTGLDLAGQFDPASFSLIGTLQGIALGAAFLVGFESCAALAAEAREPRRSIPLAVMAVPVVLGLTFPLVTILQVPGLVAASDDLAAGVSAPAALALQAGLGTGVATATDVVLAIATFAALLSFVNYGARFAMALAQDGLVPAAVAKIQRRYRSPYVGIAATTIVGYVVIAVLVYLTGDVVTAYNTVAPLVVYLWVAPYLLIASGAILLTVRDGEYRIGLIVACVYGGLAMAWAYLNGIINPPPSPGDAMSWVVLLVLGLVPLLLVLNRRRRRRAADETLGVAELST